MRDNVFNRQLRSKIAQPAEASLLIQNGMTVAMGGVTASGYPKLIPAELIKRKMAGEDLQINLISGSSVGPEIDEAMSTTDIIRWRAPLTDSRMLAKRANMGQVSYVEQQMHKMPFIIQNNIFGEIDVAVIEALCITEEGYIIPTASVGTVPQFLSAAKSIIIEVNTAQPPELQNMHDIYLPGLPPTRKPIPLSQTAQKIGEPFMRVDPDKIKFIIESDHPDTTVPAKGSNSDTGRITDNLLNFLELEIPRTMAGKLPPIQTGFGNLARDIVESFRNSNFNNLEFFCGVLQEANIELIAAGKVSAASTSAVQITPRVKKLLHKLPELFKDTLILRNSDVINCAEVISRLGVVTLNSAIEVDIYGNVNSSHITGSYVVNGLGGGANFAQNAGLSVIIIPSATKGGGISTIVPMVSHCDISEHDIDVIITDQGVADLRGKDDIARARCIIENCAAEDYRDKLGDYLDRSIKAVGGHHPHILSEVFSWHSKLQETGSMK